MEQLLNMALKSLMAILTTGLMFFKQMLEKAICFNIHNGLVIQAKTRFEQPRIISLYSVIGDFFMILRLFKDVVLQIKNKKKCKNICSVI